MQISEKTTIAFSAATLGAIIITVATTSWVVSAKYENWDSWRGSVMQFIRDQRTSNAAIEASLEQIKSQLVVQKADAR